MFLNNQQVTEEMKREIKKFLETNDNENMTTQNLWDAAKAYLVLIPSSDAIYPSGSDTLRTRQKTAQEHKDRTTNEL